MLTCTHCVPTFDDTLNRHEIQLERQTITTLQVNVGKLCNQSCTHCHVDAGPWRDEMMTLATFDRLTELLAQSPVVQTVDMTGGAPELPRCIATAEHCFGCSAGAGSSCGGALV